MRIARVSTLQSAMTALREDSLPQILGGQTGTTGTKPDAVPGDPKDTRWHGLIEPHG